MEKKHGVTLPQYDHRPRYNTASIDQRSLVTLNIDDGEALIGSDGHLWPGQRTVAQRAFRLFAKKRKPYAIVLNGDMLDSASNNRHLPIGWENKPKVQQELETVGAYVDEIAKASPNSKRFWVLGNHELNFSSRLSALVPQYEGVKGTQLEDHFPGWNICWRIDINDDLVIKHRWASGQHAVFRNAVNSGRSFVTGHLHSLKVTPWTDLNGTRFGVDTGTLAEPYTEQFAYSELNPVNWRSGFVLLTFRAGRLLWPEIISKFDDDHVEFRGEVIAV